MKFLVLAILAISSDLMAEGYHYVRPYVRQDGGFVNGHMQGNPDHSQYNNLNYMNGKTTNDSYTKPTNWTTNNNNSLNLNND